MEERQTKLDGEQSEEQNQEHCGKVRFRGIFLFNTKEEKRWLSTLKYLKVQSRDDTLYWNSVNQELRVIW